MSPQPQCPDRPPPHSLPPPPDEKDPDHHAAEPASHDEGGETTADNRPYKVGKGKPPGPKWEKGYCPNRLGRGAGRKNFKTYVADELKKKVKVREGTRVVTMTKGQIGAIKLVNKWTETGDPKAYDKIVAIMGEETVRGAVATAFEKTEVRQETNRTVLDWYRDMILRTEADRD